MYTPEEKIILHCSKIEFTEDDRAELKSMLMQNPDWGKIYSLAAYNKVIGLVSHKLLMFTTEHIPGLMRRQFLFMNAGNAERNRTMFLHLKNVISVFEKAKLKYALLKGPYMINEIYKNPALRLMNDIDILIERADFSKVGDVVVSLGYKMGAFSENTMSIEPATVSDDDMYKNYIGNLYPYVKLVDDPFTLFMQLDFSFNVNPIKPDNVITSKMLYNRTSISINDIQGHTLDAPDFLIHLCTHLYKEAFFERTEADKMQILNLIKFVDVRELIITKWISAPKEQWDILLRRMDEYQLNEAVQYSIYCASEIFKDAFWGNILNRVGKYEDSANSDLAPMSSRFLNVMFRRGESH